ncbi:hypothetical protein [Chryseobacterium indologenes]|uniref:hypothetical protein n=1 Tax=Chryseobacterium indologenes TaxID=253 RepID=UPI0030180AAE
MAEGEKTLREIQEAKSIVEHGVSELVKDFMKKFPTAELYINVEYTYSQFNTECGVKENFCKVEVKAGVRI